MRFKVINKTRFRTRHLRKFVVRAYRTAATSVGVQLAARHAQSVRCITITLSRRNGARGSLGASGHAWVGSGKAHVSMGDNINFNKSMLAYVLAHEIGHCLGHRHADMAGGPLDCRAAEKIQRVYGWADALPLEPVAQPVKPTSKDRLEARLKGIEARLEAWQTKQRRAERAVKKLTLQKRRLTKSLGGLDKLSSQT